MSSRTPSPQVMGHPGRRERMPLLVLSMLAAALVMVASTGRNPWDALFVDPMINVLLLFNNVLLGHFGAAIIVFTLFMRAVTLPLTIRQFQSTKALTAIQPRLQEIQKKYKDPRRRQEETLKLYRQAGVNPLGCLLPMLVQFPVWIALYRALIIMVGGTPDGMLSLAHRIYPWPYLYQAVPLQQEFLWLHLGRPDATFVLPILVGITTYIQQKVSTAPAATREQQQMNQTLNWMMPLMFVWITMAVPSGLGLYWVVSNVASVFIGYFVYGARGVDWRRVFLPLPQPAAPAKSKTSKREGHDKGRRGGYR
jgi:YidC/Oxa1 family membrane protein insertase